VTSGGLFWMVAFDPARWAMRGLGAIGWSPSSVAGRYGSGRTLEETPRPADG
jgi:hypothetical protein